MQYDKLRICHVIGSLRIGGAEKLYVHLLNEIDVDLKDALLLTSNKNGKLLNELSANVNIHYQPVKFLFSPYYIIKLAMYFRKKEFNVVHAHMFWASFYAVLAAKLAGIPVVFTTEHGMNPWKKQWHYFIEHYLITPFSDMRICVSKDILENRHNKDRLPINKLHFIPNGISKNKYKPRHYSKGVIKLLAAGRFIEAKDYETLIDAAKKLQKKNIDFILNIVGDGELFPVISNKVSEYGLSDVVKLQGVQSNVIDWMYDADIFVMSSKREGQPIVILEAMSTGLPIVSTSVGGIPDTLENNKDALLVKSENAELLANAINKLVNNNELANKLGYSAYNKMIENFSINAISTKLCSMYFKVLSEKKTNV